MTAPLDKAWFEDYEVPMALPTIELGLMAVSYTHLTLPTNREV